MYATADIGRNLVSKHHIDDSARVWRMSRLTRDRTAKPVSRGQILRRARKQVNIHFPSSADYEQGWHLARLVYTLLYVMTIREGLSGGCRAGLTLERCSQLAVFAIQPVG